MGGAGSSGSKCKTGACKVVVIGSTGGAVTSYDGTCAGGYPSIPGSFWDVVGSWFFDTSSACYCSVPNISFGSVNNGSASHCTA